MLPLIEVKGIISSFKYPSGNNKKPTAFSIDSPYFVSMPIIFLVAKRARPKLKWLRTVFIEGRVVDIGPLTYEEEKKI